MNMAELKAALKETKTFIKNGDFSEAEKCCKLALKIDKKNYQALVLFGKVNQELGKYPDAKKILMLATQVDSEQSIAWQGLSALHEKHTDIFTDDEGIAILIKIISFIEGDDKIENVHRRLARIYQKSSLLKAAMLLHTLAMKINDKNRIYEAWKSIIDLLSPIRDPSKDEIQILSDAFKNVLNDSVLGDNESNYRSYLRLLYKTDDFALLFSSAQDMARIFPTAYPLEWIARVFVESKENGLNRLNVDDDVFIIHIEKLLMLNNESPWGSMSMGIILKQKGNHDDAKKYFRLATEKLQSNLLAWIQLLESQENTNDFCGCEITCRKLIQVIQGQPEEDLFIPKKIIALDDFVKDLFVRQARALCKMRHKNHIIKAIDILEDQAGLEFETCYMLINAYLRVGKVANAIDKLKEIEGEFSESKVVELKLLKASIAKYLGNGEKSKAIYEDILSNNPSCPEALLEVGKILYDEREYQKSFICLLKSAKFNPNLSEAFLFLGHSYCHQENLDKARKCYEKALLLDGSDEDIGAALSDVYRKTQDHDANLFLLMRVTSELGRSGGGWAWFRLGLHHLSQKNFNEAVKSLQYAVQINPKDSIWHECLGDAYLTRGSLTAALKMFQRSVELSEGEALYQKCQIAKIKHLIGEHLSSIMEYESVLSLHPMKAVCTVALVGISEVLLTKAAEFRKQKLFLNLKQQCMKAIFCLTRAAKGMSDNRTIWKLLGDACTMQVEVPISLCSFEVPRVLIHPESGLDEVYMELNKVELLQLGARCYGVGLQLSQTSAELWHDLGLNMLMQGLAQMESSMYTRMGSEDDESTKNYDKFNCAEVENCFTKAMTFLKKSLANDSSNSASWNILGIVAFFRGNFAFCQHCLIQSINIKPSVEAWSHLGCLYLTHSESHLAYEAFAQAQALDPTCVTPWSGQALVAESIGHYEAFDLFRHSNLLGINTEACLGFAHHILDKSLSSKSKKNSRNKVFMEVSSDCLEFYTREKESDIVALNMYGIHLEMRGLQKSAISTFEKARKACKENLNVPTGLQDCVSSNYSRCLIVQDRLDESIELLTTLNESDFHSLCSLALAKLRAGDFEAAYQSYSSALFWLSEDSSQKNQVLVALAFLQYKFKQMDQVKTLLFQSSSGGNPSMQGLLALTALGLNQEDPTLTAAALNELEPFKDDRQYICDIAFLKAANLILQGKQSEAKLFLSRTLHAYPNYAPLWRTLSHLLLTTSPNAPSGNLSSVQKVTLMQNITTKCANAASAAAANARVLSQAAGDQASVSQDCIQQALAYLKASKYDFTIKKTKGKKLTTNISEDFKTKAQLEAQRAVVMCPSSTESWAVLIASLNDKKEKLRLSKFLAPKCKPALNQWLKGFRNNLQTQHAN